jgi:four helix bundle protein
MEKESDIMSNAVLDKSKTFAIRIIDLYKALTDRKEYIMSKQVARSGTSIGANITESEYAQSHADFISKRSIALKEAAETLYWLDLLQSTGYISEQEHMQLSSDCTELIRLLTASVNTAKRNSPH